MGKNIRDVVKAAGDQGWTVDTTKKGHIRATPRDKSMRACIFSGTPGDVRAIDNFISACRRSGLIWPWPPRKGK